MVKQAIKIALLILTLGLFLHTNIPAQAPDDENAFLDKVQKQAFLYFWNETDPYTGLTYNTTEPGSPATNSASGFMLSSLLIGIEHGWISREEGYDRALRTLKTFQKIQKSKGFTYHYFNIKTGRRMWGSEVSCIDTALFLAGALTVAEYFNGTEVQEIAEDIFLGTDWNWFLNGENVLQMSWKPETGFSARINTFSEGIIAYIMAMGSPTYPVSGKCWDSFLRPVSEYEGRELIYVADGSLFQYLFPLAWLDLRDKHDKYADYWQNAISAVKANRQYCMNNADKYETYKKGYWGLSACLTRGGYKIFGGKPGKNKDDGTVAPYAVGGSIPLVPGIAIPTYKKMYQQKAVRLGKYGLTDAFNLDQNWQTPYYISIDKGLTLLMIENYRTGLIWKYFMRNKYIREGLRIAGFERGRQDEPSELAEMPGNPGDVIVVTKANVTIETDGALDEWDSDMPHLVLTTQANKNVEIILGPATDDDDVSGIFYLSWDDDNFYVAGKVKDDDIVCSERGGRIYLDDCVEVFFDTNKDGYYFDGNPHDYQLGISPSGPEGQAQIWAWGYRDSKPGNIVYNANMTSEGYELELAIPFSEINGIKPTNGESVYFSISIHDRDEDDKTAKLTWSIDSTSQPGKIIFGTLRLAD